MPFNVPENNNKQVSVDEIYTFIDFFLDGLKNGSIITTLEHRHTHANAIALMEKLELFTYRARSAKTTSIIDITPIGLNIINNGGIRKYFLGLEEKEKANEEFQKAEMQKIHLEIEDLVTKISDYDRVKSQAKWSIIFAGISTVAAIIAIWISLQKP